MFLGYQNDKIAFVAETREELENIPCVTLDKIEETDKTYFLHNGSYVCEVPLEQQIKEVEQTRASLYAAEVDPLMAEYNRKKTFNLFEEGEEAELLAEIEKRVAEIKENHKYPVEESEVITPTDETEQVTNQVTEQVTEQVEESEVIEDGLQKW